MGFLAILRKDLYVVLRCYSQVIHGSKINNSGTQCVTSFMRRSYSGDSLGLHVSDKTLTRLRRFDGVSKDFELIYRAPRSLYYSFAHGTVIITGLSVPIMFFILAKNSNFNFPKKIGDQLLSNSSGQFYVALGFALFIISMLFKLVTRYPLRMYRRKSTDDYIAAYANLFLPWKMTLFHFKKGDVTSGKVADYMQFQLSNFEIKGHKNIIFEEHFFKPAELEYMMAAKPKIK